MYTPKQQEDLELWKEWKKTKSPIVLEHLLSKLAPLINREVSKWGATVPRVALESKARMLVVKALEDYSPDRGAAIGTHITNRLRKLSRHVYPYQNVARLPENKQLLYNTFQIAQNKLFDQHGRDPTTDELADELSWSKRKIKDFRESVERKELVESEGAYLEEDPTTAGLVDFYYHGLSPADQLLFEDITGYGGKRPLTNNELLRKYKLTQGQLSYRKRKFIDQLSQIQRGEI